MHVRVMFQQQATTTDRTTRGTTERAERPERPERREPQERPEQPERPERAESPDLAPGRNLRDELRDLARAQRDAAADLRREAEDQANQVIIRNGVPVPAVPPVPPVPGFDVHVGDGPMIPPQAVDLAYGFYAMVAVMVIGWPFARAWGRRLERSGPSLAPAMGEQLQRIEQTVDAMAVEVERISEAQRYLTKLQSGRVAESAGLQSGDGR